VPTTTVLGLGAIMMRTVGVAAIDTADEVRDWPRIVERPTIH
jgi:hypothetical protein